MKAGNIKLVHNFTGETGYVIITWQSTTAPLTEIGRQVYPAPHSQESLLIEDLDPIMHLVKAYRSSDGIALDEQINELACDAGARSTYSTTTYTYIVGRGESGDGWSDPVADSIELRDTRLLNQSYEVFERGTGQLIPPTEVGENEYIDRSDAGGGFDFYIDGKVFNEGATYFVTVHNRVDNVSSGSGSGSGSEVEDVLIIDSNQDFNASTMNGKLLYVDYASAVVGVLTFPNLSLIPDCSFKVSTQGGLQTYFSLQLDAGDVVRFRSQDKNVIHLGKSEDISIMIRNNVMYVLNDGTNYKNIGQRVWGDAVELNTIIRDGTQYNQSDMVRLMEWIDALNIETVTEAQWASSSVINGDTVYPYKHKFARDDVAGKIRIPDDRDHIIGGLKNTDGVTSDSEYLTQKAGGYQHFKTSMKGVKVGIRNGSGGSSTGSISNTGFSGQDNYSSWITEGGTEAHIRFNNASDGFTGVDETREKKYGMIPLLII